MKSINCVLITFESPTSTHRCKVSPYFVSVIITISLLIANRVKGMPAHQTLYDQNDPLLILASHNFSSNVHGQPKVVTVVQFYNSWCGHCIHFAPIYKQFANKVRRWSPLKLAVIDCAEEINLDKCRDLDVNVYPSIRLFWSDAKESEKGVDLKGDERTSLGLQHSIIAWLVENWYRGVPRQWPDLHPISALGKEKLLRMLPIAKGKPVVIVVEKDDSFVGREVVLDLSAFQEQVVVFRMVESSKALLDEILPQPLEKYKLPLLVTAKQDYSFEIVQKDFADDETAREEIVRRIKQDFIHSSALSESHLNIADDKAMQKKTSEADSQLENDNRANKVTVDKEDLDLENFAAAAKAQVFMVDLNNALRYSLFQEIALKKSLNSTQLNALKRFLSVIELHFPFASENMKKFVKNLNDWLANKAHSLLIEEMIATMKVYESYYPFPAMRSWKGCAGSKSRYRGYPCSMWTLFHVLTVSEYRKTLKSARWSNLHSVLYAMRDYIGNFFTCTQCAMHFGQMAHNLENELLLPNSSVLWLWRAHNKVNGRLKSDESEDPKHPKIQFPLKSRCPACRKPVVDTRVILWDQKEVLPFLVNFYGEENIVKDKDDLDEVAKPQEDFDSDFNVIPNDQNNSENLLNVESKRPHSMKKVSQGILNKMDYSLILLLYVVSASLMVALCIFLKLRGRRKLRDVKRLNNFAYKHFLSA